jgi:hypothetical protein
MNHHWAEAISATRRLLCLEAQAGGIFMYRSSILGLFGWVLLMSAHVVEAGPVCQPIAGGQFKCTIRSAADCLSVEDYPYARNLYCPASFNAVNQVFDVLVQGLGLNLPIERQFFFYQTKPPKNAHSPDYLDPAQTTVPCLETPAPWNPALILGAGVPLCDLLAYVSSIGQQVILIPGNGNPLPPALRRYPDYFSHLLVPTDALPLAQFRMGGSYDPLVKALGRDGADVFEHEAGGFTPSTFYSPSPLAVAPDYQGISGGGGAGWGGEIVLTSRSLSRTLLAFGGGGGGGLTSMAHPDPSSTISSLGAGGGGGMQFANGYHQDHQSYNQLGLGAGTSSNEQMVQYSYYQPITGDVTHTFDPAIVSEYQTQLLNLFSQLDQGLRQQGEVILKGGGGMGAGAEYLDASGEEYVPHAVSTQAGFQFRFKIGKVRGPIFPSGGLATVPEVQVTSQQQKLYLALGNIYQFANQQAFTECGNSYDHYECICPVSQAIVICLAHQVLGGSVASIPGWIQQAHCPVVSDAPDEFESLMNAVPYSINAPLKSGNITLSQSSCKKAIKDYSQFLRTPPSSPQ